MFQNPEIALDALPTAEDLDWQKLHPQLARRMRIQALIVLGIVAVAISALNLVPNIPLLPILILYSQLAVAAAISLLWPGLSVPRRGYVVRDRDILFRRQRLDRLVNFPVSICMRFL